MVIRISFFLIAFCYVVSVVTVVSVVECLAGVSGAGVARCGSANDRAEHGFAPCAVVFGVAVGNIGRCKITTFSANNR